VPLLRCQTVKQLGHKHSDCIKTAMSIPAYRKANIVDCEQGFITSENEFVNRAEALKIQLDANIPSKSGYRGSNQLFSEDLY